MIRTSPKVELSPEELESFKDLVEKKGRKYVSGKMNLTYDQLNRRLNGFLQFTELELALLARALRIGNARRKSATPKAR
jgi:hypothetical protein